MINKGNVCPAIPQLCSTSIDTTFLAPPAIDPRNPIRNKRQILCPCLDLRRNYLMDLIMGLHMNSVYRNSNKGDLNEKISAAEAVNWSVQLFFYCV